MQRVWLLWALRAFLPAGLLLLVLVLEAVAVSVPQIVRGTLEASHSLSGLLAYWTSAVEHTEPLVLAGLLAFFVTGYATWRNLKKGVYARQNILARWRVI
jgi:hypothetical protein